MARNGKYLEATLWLLIDHAMYAHLMQGEDQRGNGKKRNY